ncbi:tetratricopeptide repeat protein [Dyadobacter psychrotolerans]|uniref:Tetratricopeptide repeat protein n=1 Tax=Dyadobacter psychrotolerans TaxID=2541721 RepID=A0A4V2Z4Q3_9BACT|nr:tetratricopeptide repeat protein [Dyadobacter psychrotolerans]TDE16528.1 tetratricopeptide repeat protein [Dyadobacter psychrotolerans]
MAKLLTLFISLSLVVSVQAQSVDCSSKAVQDSLFEIYSKKARAYGFLHPGWDQTYDSLLAICPNIAEAYQEKGIPHVANGNYEKAYEYNNKAVELDPHRWTPYRGYLNCIYTKNYEKAITDFEAAEKLTPNAFILDHSFSFYIALSYMESGQYDKAETYFLKDIAQQKRGEGKNDIHFNSLLYFGILYYLMNEFDMAQKYLRDCLVLYPQQPMANYYMAMTLKVLGNNQKDIYFEKAKQYMLEGYRLNEPNSLYVNYPRQITMFEIEQR